MKTNLPLERILAALVGCLTMLVANATRGATLTVTNLNDNGPGTLR